MKINAIVKKLNQLLLTGFAKTYMEHNPVLSSLAATVVTGNKSSVKYLFYQFVSGLRKFTGNRVYDSFPDTYNFVIYNEKFDKGLEIDVDDLEEGMEISADGQLIGADPYTLTINSMSSMAKDHPFEMMVTLIENGTSTTPLTTEGIGATITALDGKALFSATHDYSNVAGTQSNILTGTGIALANLEADLLSVISAFAGFYYKQNGTINSKKRSLNRSVTKVNIHCPVEMLGIFTKLKSTAAIAATGDNVVGSYIQNIVTHQFTDTNDWYVELVDAENPFMRPLLNQVRKAPMLSLGQMTDESVKQNDKLQYGVRYKGMVGIGAWWKMLKVTNT